MNALGENTIGNNNTANGMYALAFNTIGNNNTANGVNALLRNRGNNNTADGFMAGYALLPNWLDGSDNTFL